MHVALGVAIFATLFGLTARRGVRDPVCGMQVDRDQAVRATLDGRTVFFCSEHCRHTYLDEHAPAVPAS